MGIRFPGQQKNCSLTDFFPPKTRRANWMWPLKWALCTRRSHDTKITLLDGKWRSGTFKRKVVSFLNEAISLFFFLSASFAIQQGVFLYHVTVSCKEPIGYMESRRENVTIQLAGQISYSLCSMSVHIFLQGSIPFAVIGSNTITEVRGKQVRVRQYPWGMAEGLLI